MGWLGLSFDVANIVILPLLLGIGVDAGAHVMARCQQAAREHGGVAPLGELHGTTGVALVGASLTTIAGFAALMVGDYGAMKSLGAPTHGIPGFAALVQRVVDGMAAAAGGFAAVIAFLGPILVNAVLGIVAGGLSVALITPSCGW